jgi:GDPmannose 4,6-dehydratase
MKPVSPYGCSKLLSYSLVRNYRHAYNIFAANGILFNHESPRRGSNFVTTKIIKGAWQIKKGNATTLELGNLDSYRDWGHAKDYIKAMQLILNHPVPDDFVIATGVTHSVREFCEIAFKKLNLNYQDHIVTNPKYFRPEELNYLRGNSTKARTVLGWTPHYTFESLVEEMIINLEPKK